VIRAARPGRVAVYIGNPTRPQFLARPLCAGIHRLAGLRHIYSAGTVDQWPKNVVAALMYGGMWAIPVPDPRPHRLPADARRQSSASQGSLLAAPDVLGRLDRHRARGGRVVLLDPAPHPAPRRMSIEWLPIRPGTDALLLAGDGARPVRGRSRAPARARRHCQRRRRGARAGAGVRAGGVADACAVPAATIAAWRTSSQAAPTAAVYGRIGTCTQEFGTLASWLVEVLNILTGNLDQPGGSQFAPSGGVADEHAAAARPAARLGNASLAQPRPWRSRSARPGPAELYGRRDATPGPGQLRALITIAGNPAIERPTRRASTPPCPASSA
jgi:hypothetical protein